tara:strand:- start:483 stop:1817 length:1335 start_codon:yes stop_codon:yes gene_type:complete
MKLKQFREKLSKMSGSKLTGQEISVYMRKNPGAKKDPKVRKAVEFALDHGGAMTFAVKGIEKIKKGLSDHPEVKKALQYANESTLAQMKEDLSDSDKQKIERLKRDIQDHEVLIARLKDQIRQIKGMSEDVNEETLSEALSKKLSDREVKALQKKFGNFGEDELKDLLNDYSPAKTAMPKRWVALSYPVRDGDYYFAFIADDEKKNTKFNSKLNDILRNVGRGRIVGGANKKQDLLKDVWAGVSKEVKKFPKDLGWGDTMTREEIYNSILHMIAYPGFKESLDEVTVDKMRVGRRQKAPKYETTVAAKSLNPKTQKKAGVIGENYRTLAQKGMGTETPASISMNKEMDYYDHKGNKRQGKVIRKDKEGYIVKDLDDGRNRKFMYLDREKAKDLLRAYKHHESTAAWAKSLEKIKKQRQLDRISDDDKATLRSIMALLDKEKKKR